MISSSNTYRHKDSAVPYLQGLLNRNDFENKIWKGSYQMLKILISININKETKKLGELYQ